eukprot:4613482-Lingulodinium_polyedra.AAC.1
MLLPCPRRARGMPLPCSCHGRCPCYCRASRHARHASRHALGCRAVAMLGSSRGGRALAMLLLCCCHAAVTAFRINDDSEPNVATLTMARHPSYAKTALAPLPHDVPGMWPRGRRCERHPAPVVDQTQRRHLLT